MVIQIQIQDDTWKRLNQLKKPGQTFDDVIKHNLNSEDKKDGDNKMANVEIEKSNIRSKTKIHDNVKTKVEQNGGSEELPEPIILNKND